MGRGVTHRPQLETNSDSTVTSSTSSLSTTRIIGNSMASPSVILRNQPSTSNYLNATKLTKADPNIWFPYDHSDTQKPSNIGFTGSMFDRTRKSPAISPSCRYYPSSTTTITPSISTIVDKSDPYASYASTIGIDSVSTQQQPLRSASTSLQSSTATSVPYGSHNDPYISSHHHHHNHHNLLHTSTTSAYHHQIPSNAQYHSHGTGTNASASVGHALSSPVHNYSLIQNIAYDTTGASAATAAAASRCALPSPTIFPPTPPPSAPWNPWAGF